MEGAHCVLLDIEGTICPISFVKETLFPYAIKALPDVLNRQWHDPEFQQLRDAFPEEHRASPSALQAHVEDLTRRDVKIAYLKNLQGYLWKDGYSTGAYTTPLFPEVAPQLQRWKEQGAKLAIYSSGSVFAQKLLFQHVKRDDKTEDLTHLIDGWFDTTNAGLKNEAASYEKIAEALGLGAGQILFLTDNVKEVDAAKDAGMRAILVDRPGNAPVSDMDRHRMHVVDTLEAV